MITTETGLYTLVLSLGSLRGRTVRQTSVFLKPGSYLLNEALEAPPGRSKAGGGRSLLGKASPLPSHSVLSGAVLRNVDHLLQMSLVRFHTASWDRPRVRTHVF